MDATPSATEPTPDNTRLVQYFDKGGMQFNPDPVIQVGNPAFVMASPLAYEMITGRLASGQQWEPPGIGIAAVSTAGYCGFLAGPPLIGLVAEASGLPLGLGLVAAVVGLMVLGTGVLSRPPAPAVARGIPTRIEPHYPYSDSGEFPGGASGDCLDQLALLGREPGVAQQFQVGDDPGERRAQLVADRGEEGGLQRRGVPGRLALITRMVGTTGFESFRPLALYAVIPYLDPVAGVWYPRGGLHAVPRALAGAPVPGEEGRAHIGVIAVDGAGATVAYRKMWLGGAECDRFAPGGEPAVLDIDGWRLGLAVCKDTGVPQQADATAALGINAYAAGVLENEEDAAVPDERARRVANDHHVWVAVASFAGSTGGGYDRAAGRSGIWSPDGVAVARAGPEVGAVARATLT